MLCDDLGIYDFDFDRDYLPCWYYLHCWYDYCVYRSLGWSFKHLLSTDLEQYDATSWA